jgi:putative ABC transport system permease protein
MSFFETFRLAIKNIMGSKLRTFLTMLGIIIGVCAVIVIVGLGNGMQGYIEDSFAELGTDSLTVMIMGRGSSRSVSEEQMYDMVSEHSDLLKMISPTVSVSFPLKIGSDTVSTSTVSGVSEDYFSMKGYEIAQGRGIRYTDISGRKKVCVIGQYLNTAYYGGNAVGQTVKLGQNTLTIVGVMAAETTDLEEGGTDDCLYIPYSTAARMSGNGTISSYVVTVQDKDRISEAKSLVEDTLYAVFGDDSAYTVVSMAEMLDTMNSMVNVIIGILAAIAAISLVVGGIGIMNIMLVSVTERTREIGIRKALGARESAIMRQFVIEAATTSALGGVLGIIVGYSLSSVATVVITAVMEADITVAPSMGAVLLAFGVSTGIGVVFGYLPAKKAATLNPIDALRYE